MFNNQPLLFQKKVFPSLDETFLILKNEIKRNKKIEEIHGTKLSKKAAVRIEDPKTHMLVANKLLQETLVTNATGEDDAKRIAALRELPLRLTNPEIASAAMDFDVIEKLCSLFRRHKQGSIILSAEEEELILRSLVALTVHIRAADQIAAKPLIITEFYKMILKMDKNEEVISRILKQISNKTFSLQVLVRTPNIFSFLEQILTRPYCTLYFSSEFWNHLVDIVEQSPHECLTYNFFDIFINRVKKKLTNYTGENMKCLAYLLNTGEGQEKCFKVNGIKYLYELISPTTPPLENYEYVLLALRNATKNDVLVEDCRRYNELPDILLNLAVKRQSINEQLYCLEIVKHITKLFCNHLSVRTRCAESLRKLKTCSQTAEHIRMDLVRGIATPLDFFSIKTKTITNDMALPLDHSRYIPPY